MELQEHLMAKSEEILKTIEDFLANEDESKEKLSKEFALNNLFMEWLSGYTLHQPSEFLLETGL